MTHSVVELAVERAGAGVLRDGNGVLQQDNGLLQEEAGGPRAKNTQLKEENARLRAAAQKQVG